MGIGAHDRSEPVDVDSGVDSSTQALSALDDPSIVLPITPINHVLFPQAWNIFDRYASYSPKHIYIRY